LRDRRAHGVSRCLISCISVLAAGLACGQSDRVVKTYEADSAEGAPFSRLLIVGAHRDTDIRRRFEDSVADSISSSRTSAVASLDVMDRLQPLNEATLVAAATEAEADAVLVTRMIDVQRSAEFDRGRSTAVATRRDERTLVDFFRYDYAEIPDPTTVTVVSTVVVSSDLYRLEDRAKLWSAESTAFEKEDASDAINSISKGLARRLKRDRFVR